MDYDKVMLIFVRPLNAPSSGNSPRKPEFHSIYILWTTIVNECARWDFVSPLEVDYSDFEGVDEPESLSDCFNFYFYHDSGAKMTIAECQNIVNLKLFPTQKTTTTTTTTSKATTRTEAKTTTHVTTTSTTQKSTTSSTKMKSTMTKSSKFTKLLITTKKPTTVSEVKIDVIRKDISFYLANISYKFLICVNENTLKTGKSLDSTFRGSSHKAIDNKENNDDVNDE